MGQPAEQVRFRLDPTKDLFVGNEELDVARGPEVAYPGTAQVPDEADVRYENAGDEDEDKRRGPGGNLVGSDAGGCQKRVYRKT